MSWFSKVLAYHPCVILIVVTVFAVACFVIPLTSKKFPSFSDPTLGFETRGTTISQRLTAWHNLLEASRPSGFFTLNPKELLLLSTPSSDGFTTPKPTNKSYSRKPKKPEIYVTQPYVAKLPTATPPGDLSGQKNWTFGINVSETQPDSRNDSAAWKSLWELSKDKHSHGHDHLSKDGFFCNAPVPEYAHIVLSTIDGSDFLSLSALRSACSLDLRLRKNPYFDHICQRSSEDGGSCCHSWALHNYIAALYGHTSCTQIQEEDVQKTRELLMTCAPHYHSRKLPSDCQGNNHAPVASCFKLASECIKHNAVYNIIHYLVDTDFLPPNNTKSTFVAHSMLFLPMARSKDILPFYKALDDDMLIFENVEVSAMDLGIKSILFEDCLLRDTWLISIGALCVFLCMWTYTGSFLVTSFTIVAVAFSLAISYFFYKIVFVLEFFPFMNLLAFVVAVGIGADDAFIYCKLWHCIKREKRNASVLQLVQETLNHAALSMFVTSFTTTVAFFASCISSITAIRCFSIFAGMSVIANLVLMVTWLPATVILSENMKCPTWNWLPFNSFCHGLRTRVEKISALFDQCFIFLVNRAPYVWITLLGFIALASATVVVYRPGLHLPDSPDFQLFDQSHLFEKYDAVYSKKFWFEKLEKHSANMRLPLRFVWGVHPVDNGDYMNPYARGKLQLDPTFDMLANESQVWLKDFCVRLREQPFYQSSPGPILDNCFIETLESWMKNRRCKDDMGDGLKDRSPCCETSSFPYKRHVLRNCTIQAMESLYRTPNYDFGYGGPRFTKNVTHPRLRAVVVEYDSKISYSMSYQEMDSFYSQVEDWMQQQLSEAPPGMRHGWFISELRFFDLQQTISGSTVTTIAVSMIMSLVVLLVVTLNVLVSFFAILSITCTIFATVAAFVLLGWQLNVLESIAICTAIGLSVDFSLHYSVSYRLAPDNTNREEAVKFSLKRMAGPTAMGALTTAFAGVFMLPSSVLAYIQIGLFLVILMVISWIYSTLFLMSLLRVAGPRHGFCQFSHKTILCCFNRKSHLQRTSDTVGGPSKRLFSNMLAETSLSASSTNYTVHASTSESHELDSLTNPGRRASEVGELSGSVSFTRTSQRTIADQSPRAESGCTAILSDDVDLSSQHM